MTYRRLLLAFVISTAVALAANACSSTSTAPSSTAACTITAGSVATTVAAAGITGTIPVTAGTGCGWTATSGASFITLTPASGTGSGTVTYSVASNQGAQRTGTLTIAGTTVTFTQQAPLAPANCAVALSSTAININSGGGTGTVGVTGATNCGWTATSNSSFLTITGGASSSGNGTVTITATANTGAVRTGTVTIGGQNVTVSQDPALAASFTMFDPSTTIGEVTECRFRSGTSQPTTCTLQSTSFASGRSIVNYAWTISYTYGITKTITVPTSVFPTQPLTDTCGGTGSTDTGAANPLTVTLTITDSNGNTATATSGSGSQPPLSIRMFTCGL